MASAWFSVEYFWWSVDIRTYSAARTVACNGPARASRLCSRPISVNTADDPDRSGAAGVRKARVNDHGAGIAVPTIDAEDRQNVAGNGQSFSGPEEPGP